MFARLATQSEAPRLVHTLCRAFADSSLVNWLVIQDSRVEERRRMIYEAFVNVLGFGQGEVWTTEGNTGVAIWHRPGRWRMSAFRQLQFLPLFLSAAGAKTSWQKFIGLNRLERLHPKMPHCYLLVLGVDPAYQGQGHGRELLKPLLHTCDAHHLPAYLETPNPDNIAIYERYGFRVSEKIKLPFDGPMMWTMWRE